MLGWIREKMAIQKLALGGGKFSASGSIAVRSAPQHAMACALQVEEPIAVHALQAGTVQLSLGMALRTTPIHLTCLVGVRG
jgi:hypothetical protein